MNTTALNNTSDASDENEKAEKAPQVPRNLQRASKLRTKAAQFRADFVVLDRWAKNETDDGKVAALTSKLKQAQTLLEESAVMYEDLPDSVLKTRRGGSKVEIKVGMIVKVKDKFVDTYTAISNGDPVDHLEVLEIRNTHVLIKTAGDERFFVQAKELQPREDA